MIVIVLISSVLMATVTITHFKNENQRYHFNRIERKENRVITHINNILNEHKEVTTEKDAIELISSKLKELSLVHSLRLFLYDTSGNFISSSDSVVNKNRLDQKDLDYLSYNLLYIKSNNVSLFEQINLESYSYIRFRGKNLAILYLPYFQENSIFKNELQGLLLSIGELYLLLLLGAVFFAYLVSSYITKSLKLVSQKINRTEIGKNKPLEWNSDDEIGKLVSDYNRMIQNLENSARLLAKSEREQAWREMAKQVAHEIKNPLTPLRLEVQLLERRATKFEKKEERDKVLDFTKGVLLQIDTLSRIANEFSNFAKMPSQELSFVDFSMYVKNFSKFHSHNTIEFHIEDTEMPVMIDEKQFSRVLTNLLTNAQQAIPEGKEADIKVKVKRQGECIVINISDNGVGIDKSEWNKIFEPRFTTKTVGMGLGLGIAKNIIESLSGTITFDSRPGKGTVFTINLPIYK